MMETCLHFNVKSDSISRAKLALPSSHSLLSLLLPFLGNAKMKTFDSSIKSRKIEFKSHRTFTFLIPGPLSFDN